MAAIEIAELRRTYTSSTGLFAQKRVVREALRGVSLDVPERELFGLLGPNGAGKTTLVKILATILLPTSGSVHILGEDVVRDASSVRARIGLVFGGERGLYGTLTGRDTLAFWGDLYRLNPKIARRRVDEVLHLVGLTQRANERVETYSRGMKQRLHLARGILHEPRLLLLDEPTIGLDPVAANEIRGLIRRLRDSGMTVFLTTHYMAEAEALCDRVAFINDGEIILVDAPQALTRVAGERLVLEVSVSSGALARLRDDLAQQSGSVVTLSEQSANDGATTLRLEVSRDRFAQLIERLARYEPTRLTTVEPSLEDVYLRLLGERGMRV